jgi:anaerobic magnesium-protoporphyrin IX monomethyl ester cyclase
MPAAAPRPASSVTGPGAWIALVGPEVAENLSLRYLASSLSQAGYRVEILAFNGERDFSRIVAIILGRDWPDAISPFLVGLSLAFQNRAEDFLALAMALREGGYRGHLTAGGHFATFEAKALLQNFTELDSICRFEAEQTVVELARGIETNASLDAVAGLALRRDQEVVFTAPRPLSQVAHLPRPDRRGAPALCFGHPIMPLVGSRGCYGHCNFCCIAAWNEAGGAAQRFRLREVDDVADEMAEQHRSRGIEIFVFEDDNFFLPRPEASLARIHGLADALAARGVQRFATAVKARPNDVDPKVFAALVERLHCLRAYVGLETDSPAGLVTLGRGTSTAHNHRALDVVSDLGLHIAFNVLLFDPDTGLGDIVRNVAFMRAAAEHAFCVGRVELLAGTPILARMQAQGRCQGDFLRRDYRLASHAVERAFRLFLPSMMARNFGDDAPVVRLMLLRFDVEVARFFHPAVYRETWRDRTVALTRRLSLDTAAVLEITTAHCAAADTAGADASLGDQLEDRCRRLDDAIAAEAQSLAEEMSTAVGRVASLCEVRSARDNPIAFGPLSGLDRIRSEDEPA